MNETGAHVKSAVAIGISTGGCIAKPLQHFVDQPFYIWIERPGFRILYSLAI